MDTDVLVIVIANAIITKNFTLLQLACNQFGTLEDSEITACWAKVEAILEPGEVEFMKQAIS